MQKQKQDDIEGLRTSILGVTDRVDELEAKTTATTEDMEKLTQHVYHNLLTETEIATLVERLFNEKMSHTLKQLSQSANDPGQVKVKENEGDVSVDQDMDKVQDQRSSVNSTATSWSLIGDLIGYSNPSQRKTIKTSNVGTNGSKSTEGKDENDDVTDGNSDGKSDKEVNDKNNRSNDMNQQSGIDKDKDIERGQEPSSEQNGRKKRLSYQPSFPLSFLGNMSNQSIMSSYRTGMASIPSQGQSASSFQTGAASSVQTVGQGNISSLEVTGESKSTLEVGLSHDTYTMMVLSPPFSGKYWWFGTGIFILQCALLGFILFGQIVDEISGEVYQPVFNTPINYSPVAAIAQLPAIFVAILMTKDIIQATKCISILLLESSVEINSQRVMLASARFSSDEWNRRSQSDSIDATMARSYRNMVLYPYLLKTFQGLLSLVTSFIIIVSSSNVIDLFKDFMALQIISNIDDIGYYLCAQGFFGRDLQQRSEAVNKIYLIDESEDTSQKICRRPSLNTLVVLLSFTSMVIGWGVILRGQMSGAFYRMKYPQCQVQLQGLDITRIGDGKCDGSLYNRYECGFDGGDCLGYQLAYPLCDQSSSNVKPWKIADGECDSENNNEDCGWDGGDCCQYDIKQEGVFQNGICNAMIEYNNEQCKFDNGECAEHNLMYPDGCYVEDVTKLGDGTCDGGAYMTAGCNYDNGDCEECIASVNDASLLGNGECNLFESYNSEACLFDNGDCEEHNSQYPDGCPVENITMLGDGVCDGGLSLIPECGYDGGDCLWQEIGKLEGKITVGWKNDGFGSSVSLSGDATTVAIGAENSGDNGPATGQVRVYRRSPDGQWVQLGQDLNGDTPDDYFGSSVSISSDGSRVVVGARQHYNDYGRGYVMVFELKDGSWEQLGQTIRGESEFESSGHAVSISSDGKFIAQGSPYNSNAGFLHGQAEVFTLVDGRWELATTPFDGVSRDDWFGYSVSLSSDGGTVAIGSRYNDGGGEDSGHVRVFGDRDGTWVQIGEDINGDNPHDWSGYSVSLSATGNRVAIGSSWNNDAGFRAGHVRIFELIDDSWIQLGDAINGLADYDESGRAVSLSSDGNRVAIGAPYAQFLGDHNGHARVFELVDGSWIQIGIRIDGGRDMDRLGWSLSLSSDGNTVAIGVPMYRNSVLLPQVRIFSIK